MKNKTPRNHLINTYKVTEMTTDDINSVVTNNKNASALCYMLRQNKATFAISSARSSSLKGVNKGSKDDYRNMCLENQTLKTANNTDEFSSDLAMYALQNIMKAFDDGDDTLLLKFDLDEFRPSTIKGFMRQHGARMQFDFFSQEGVITETEVTDDMVKVRLNITDAISYLADCVSDSEIAEMTYRLRLLKDDISDKCHTLEHLLESYTAEETVIRKIR